MPQDLVGYKSQFSDMQWRYLQFCELGMSKTQAAKKAGSQNPRKYVELQTADPKMRSEMNVRLERNQSAMKMTRDKVQAMVMEAFDVAKLTDDANAMVRAASEINKMCGFYEIERAQIELSNSQKDFVNRLNELSDDELLAMTEAQGQINPAQELEVEESHLNGIIDAEFDEDEV